LVDGTATGETPLERALVDLARKTCTAPARLTPADLEPVRAAAGDDAIDYALVIGAFHFINRIADLLHVDAEALPPSLRRFELLRRLTVRVASTLLARMDLAPRDYPSSFDQAVRSAAPVFSRALGRPLAGELSAVAARPKIVETLALALEERDARSSLERTTLVRVHAAVEAALPAAPADVEGFHHRPTDPVEAFAFVGTRYAYRTTQAMIDALRRAGYDDLGILDLATAVADANQWARLHRLLGLQRELLSLAPAVR
jgi:alkylhydroperoxidase family enzyme